MISFEFVSNFMYENFENVSVSNNGTQFLARCPLCGDSKKSKRKRRFNLKYDGDDTVFRCFNCNESGGFKKLYFLITGEYYRECKKYDYIKEQLLKCSDVKKKTVKKDKKYIIYNSILNDCIGLKTDVSSPYLKKYKDILINFYKDRKINKNYKIYISYYGDYKDRIIIPIYNYDDIIYFQARRIFEDMLPKYKNPATEKSNIILNKNSFDSNKYIIITEGILDAYSVGKQGTCCLGKELNKDFICKIVNLTNIGIIIALDCDSDGIDSVKKYYKKVLRKFYYHTKIKYFLMPKEFRVYKDINKLKVEEKIKNMYEFILKNSYSYEKYRILI